MIAEIQIQHVGLHGQGVGFDPDGNIYFVPGSLPGDRVKVDFGETEKRYRDAKLLETIEFSPKRVESPCPVSERCGGCDWLSWDYSAQLAAKEEMLSHILSRANLVPETRLPIVPSPETLHYRNRVQLHTQGGQLGYYRRESHELVPIESCAVVHPAINEKLRSLRHNLPATAKKVELTVGPSGQVDAVFDKPHAAMGFTQVNSGQNENLRRMVAEAVRRSDSQHVLELYCGDGNLTFPYLGTVNRVLAVDSNTMALSKAKVIADRLGVANKVKFLMRSLNREGLQKMGEEARFAYDTLILDPPRQGVGNWVSSLVTESLRNIFYISCSPVSFTQDAKVLTSEGYSLTLVQGIDMFPHTRHLELFATFSR